MEKNEAPKLHGWITPEYAMEMIEEMLIFLRQNGREYYLIGPEITNKCPFMIMNAQNMA